MIFRSGKKLSIFGVRSLAKNAKIELRPHNPGRAQRHGVIARTKAANQGHAPEALQSAVPAAQYDHSEHAVPYGACQPIHKKLLRVWFCRSCPSHEVQSHTFLAGQCMGVKS